MSSRHHRTRLAVLTAVTACALLVPVSAAVASDRASVPSATTTERPVPADKAAELKRAEAAKAEAAKKAGVPEDSSREEIRKAEALKAEAAKRASADGNLPRGGVAAGEAPAEDTGATTLAGSVAGALLLAGAGTFVLRRRAAERRDA
ncbi:LPXTG cell wall anchor domain-containing protein [Streptomyces lushanensis]|uniref:LPXTG cell wall anchor domain-containing protein n=1 Tax=Streptomyces lushanensis TaxID=1434255 RepID=UPI000831F4FB|nr:LPXTG cell wall anchor domain-containing protein [Streptomyces lushanensis]